MTPNPSAEIIERLVWNGVTIELRYEPDWGGMSELGPAHRIAHIEIQVVEPVGAPLPITETGYLSHFLRPPEAEAAGGPTAFVRVWLDQEAGSKAWQLRLAAWRQLDLFG